METASSPTDEATGALKRWLSSPLTKPLLGGVAILLVFAQVVSLCSAPNTDQPLASEAEAADWYQPIWDDGTATFGDICTQGVCVAELVALPSRRPIEAAVDLEMSQTLGAMSVERIWTGERSGLFGRGWESIWDVELIDQRLTGPLPGFPLEAPEAGGEVALDGGTILQLDEQGLLEGVCVDGALCVTAERSTDSIVLRGGGVADAVTLNLEQGRVVEASTTSGRSTTYRYAEERLAAVEGDGQPIGYEYDGGGRLVSIDDGDRRSFTYDAGLVTGTTDRAGEAWTITGNDGEFTVESADGWRKYRFDGPLLVDVEDSTLGTLLTRELTGGLVSLEERPVDGVTTTRLDDGRLKISQWRQGAPPRTAILTLDERGRVVHSESMEGTTHVSYEGLSARPAKIEHGGGETEFEYDDRGLLTSTVDADGYRVEISRDDRGLPMRISDGMMEHEFSHDEAGRVIEEGSGEAKATATYDADGLLSSMVDASGRTFTPTYDEAARLTGLEGSGNTTHTDDGDSETLDQEATDAQAASTEVRRESPAPNGGTTYWYASGDSATFDAAGRVTSMTVDGRMTSREYDDHGRVSFVHLPDGTEYAAEYSSADRVVAVRSGDISATLKWHGDLLTEAQTSAGSTYRYGYDSRGDLVSASEGAAKWLYEYNHAGLITTMQGPGGVSRYSWDDLGRPTRTQESGVDRRFTWHEDEFNLAGVTESGETLLEVEWDGTRATTVKSYVDDDEHESNFGYDDEGRVIRYRLSGGSETEVTYNGNQVATIDGGDRKEAWSWKDGEVARVTVGDDDVYDFQWSSPGLVRKVSKDDETLASVEFDARGRPTSVFSGEDEDRTAEFTWTEAGLATASFDAWEFVAEYDDELRLKRIERSDQAASWSYSAGALTRFEVKGDETTYEYGNDGRLSKSIRRAPDDKSDETISWDGSGSRPTLFRAEVGEVEFSYDPAGTVEQITVADDGPENVEVDDGEVSAKGDAGRILKDAFNEGGDFTGARSLASEGPTSPWLNQLPAEFGLMMPEVVTGEDVVSAATAVIFPDTPMPLVPGGDVSHHAARSFIGLATGMEVPVGPGRVVDLDVGPDGGDIEDLMGASSSHALAASIEKHLGPGPSLWDRVVGFGTGIVNGIASIGSATWGFLTENPVGRAVLTVVFIAGHFVAGVACGAIIICQVGALGALWALGGLIDADGGGVVAALTRTALQPFEDLRGAFKGDASAILSTAVLVASLGVGVYARPLVRALPAQSLAPVCNLKRMVCISVSRFGEASDHVVGAQRNGAARMLRVDRKGAAARRRSALRDVDSRAGFDRDEYPFALSSERAGLSIRHIDPTSNRSLGAHVRHQLTPLPDGARFFVLPTA